MSDKFWYKNGKGIRLIRSFRPHSVLTSKQAARDWRRYTTVLISVRLPASAGKDSRTQMSIQIPWTDRHVHKLLTWKTKLVHTSLSCNWHYTLLLQMELYSHITSLQTKRWPRTLWLMCYMMTQQQHLAIFFCFDSPCACWASASTSLGPPGCFIPISTWSGDTGSCTWSSLLRP